MQEPLEQILTLSHNKRCNATLLIDHSLQTDRITKAPRIWSIGQLPSLTGHVYWNTEQYKFHFFKFSIFLSSTVIHKYTKLSSEFD